MDSVSTNNIAIYVVRHGECEGNVSDNFLDPFTDALTETGKAQAERLGSHFKNVPFSQVFSSDYLRAEQTAKIILDELEPSSSGLSLVTDTRLRERSVTGMIGEPTAVQWVLMATSMEGEGQGGTTTSDPEMPNCEPIDQLEVRLINFFSDLIKSLSEKQQESPQPQQQNILIISHGIALQKLMCLLNSRSIDFGITQWTTDSGQLSEKLMKNASYHKIRLEITSESEEPSEPQTENNEETKNEKIKVSGNIDSVHCRDHLLN